MKLDASALEALSDDEIEALALDWPLWARPSQLPPAGDWVTWLLMGGRGSGKTRAGAEWVRGLAAAGTGPIALVGETITEAIAVMVRGPSGLMAVTPPDERPKLSGAALHWPNGVEGMILGAADPERFRGPQFAAAWSDEIGKWPDAEAAWDMLQFGLRLGDRPRQMATTTPRPTKLLKRLLADPHTVVTRMTTAENRKHLAQSFLGAVVARYRGTLLGRQELEGELIEDLPGALWTRDMFRPFTGGVVGRKVVAVDPPTTSGAGADACGIVLAGRATAPWSSPTGRCNRRRHWRGRGAPWRCATPPRPTASSPRPTRAARWSRPCWRRWTPTCRCAWCTRRAANGCAPSRWRRSTRRAGCCTRRASPRSRTRCVRSGWTGRAAAIRLTASTRWCGR